MRLHEKGLVYRGSYMVNWSPNLQTAVSDLEVNSITPTLHVWWSMSRSNYSPSHAPP